MGTQHTEHKTKRERVFLPEGIPLYKPYRVSAAPKGRVFVPFLSEYRYRLYTQFGLESGWFSRELQECMNLFIVLVPNE